MKEKGRKLSTTKKIFLSFLVVIACGTGLLCLPFSTKAGQITSLSDALFTATSAVCVTGLIRFDTYEHWTLFGQIVILLLIQVGGVGFITLLGFFMSLTRHKIGLSERALMRDSVAAPELHGIVRMVRFVLIGTLTAELIGTALLSVYFCPLIGPAGIYYALFHAVSAFCNAGFDLMGRFAPFSSLTTAVGNVYLNVVILLLIVLGGLGFLVWEDIAAKRGRFKKLRLHSKLVLVTTAVLIVGGALCVFVFENGAAAFADRSLPEKILASIFQSVTVRTAGFNTVDLAALRPATLLVLICLMLVGGSPGSTAGGMKTTTLALAVLSVPATLRRKKEIEVFGRRIDFQITQTVCCVLMLYVGLTVLASAVISLTEPIPFAAAVFEAASAIGTVGLSLGVTPTLGGVSQGVLIALMIFGRVGSLTILLALNSDRSARSLSKLPTEQVQVG